MLITNPARRPARVVYALGLLALAAACQGTPEITRRYAQAWPTGARANAQEAPVTLTAFVKTERPPVATAAVSGLHAEGQAALIQALEAKGDALLLALGRPLGYRPATGAEPRDLTRLDRRIVFSIEKAACLSPADRIHRVEIDLAVAGGAIVDWNQFSTVHGDVDLGKVSLTQVDAFKATAGAGPYAGESLPVTLGLEASKTRTLAEEQTLKQRYVKLTGVLGTDGKRARLISEGALGIDLVGNSLVDLTVAADREDADKRVAHTFELRKAGASQSPDLITISRSLRTLPLPGAVTATLTGRYILRRVVSGETTIMEGDDVVRLEHGIFAPTTITLVPEDDIKVARRSWIIGLGQGDASAGASLYLVPVPAGTGKTLDAMSQLPSERIAFAGFDDAVAFANWLRYDAPMPANDKEYLVLGKRYRIATDFTPDYRPFAQDDRAQLVVTPVDG